MKGKAMTATNKTVRTLKIEGMTGDPSIKKVTNTLNDVDGITTKSVKSGIATISADQKGCDAACKALKNAGFKATVEAQAPEKKPAGARM